MMGKVKIPREIAKVIEEAREMGFTNCGIILMAQLGTNKINLEVIREWMREGSNDDKLLDALVKGFDVEPEYKVGDWIFDIGIKRVHQIIEVYPKSVKVEGMVIGNELIRHATPEEIAEATKPKLKVGDWVVIEKCINGDHAGSIQKLTDVLNDIYDFERFWFYKRNVELRHATPEEIKAEQERRLWAKVGREVGEFKLGDIGMTSGGFHYSNLGTIKAHYSDGALKGFYPAESFISFGECESNA